jgi:hypothetical protein
VAVASGGIDVLQHRVGGRIGSRQALLDRPVHLILGGGDGGVGVLALPFLGQGPPRQLHGVAVEPLLELGVVAVGGGVALVVTVDPVGHRLDQRRALARPRGSHRPLGRGPHGDGIVAVDLLGTDQPVGAGPLDQRRAAPDLLAAGELGELVVLDREDHRRRPQHRQGQRLVEGPRRDRALAGERHGDRAGAASSGRQTGADRDRQPRADDPVGTEDAEARVGDVHRAPLAVAGSGGAAEKLRHHRHRVGSLGQAVAVPAVRRGDVVVLLERRADPACHRLLTDRDVDEAGDVAIAELARDAGLERPDPGHLTQVLEQCDTGGGHAGSPSRTSSRSRYF